MTLVSSNEFAVNQQRYLNLARKEDVCIQNDDEGMYRLLYTPAEKQYPPQPILKPDEDFYRAITMDEFIERAVVRLEKIDKMYAKK